jgi:hypothetical protein
MLSDLSPLDEGNSVMRKITSSFLAAMFLVWAASVFAAPLEFHADFGGDGRYNTTWPLKAGESVNVDIYISNVPSPGLISMGFKLVYDPENLEIVLSGTGVDLVNWWPGPDLETGTPGEMEMAGFSLLEHKGDHIRLGTVTLRCKVEGESELMLFRRERGDWFVLFSEEGDATSVLDDDIDIGGVHLATILPPHPGDITGDGVVDLADLILVLQILAQNSELPVYANADVNDDGRIGLSEAIYILQKLSELRVAGGD